MHRRTPHGLRDFRFIDEAQRQMVEFERQQEDLVAALHHRLVQAFEQNAALHSRTIGSGHTLTCTSPIWIL